MPRAVFEHVQDADVVFGAGASFTATGFGIRFPTKNKLFVHNTLDPMDINKNIPTEYPLVGDSKLTLEMLHAALKDRLEGKPRGLTADVTSASARRTIPGWRSGCRDSPASPSRCHPTA